MGSKSQYHKLPHLSLTSCLIKKSNACMQDPMVVHHLTHWIVWQVHYNIHTTCHNLKLIISLEHLIS